MVQIIGPEGVSPVQAAVMAAQPFTQAIDRYANGGTELAHQQLQNFYQQAMAQSKINSDQKIAADRIAAEKDIATQRIEAERVNQASRDKMFLDRQDMRDKSSADRIEAKQVQDGISMIRRELVQNGVAVPPKSAEESAADYLSRLSDLSAGHVAKTNQSMGGRMFALKNQIESIDEQMGQLSQAGPIPDQVVQQAALQDAGEFIKQMETLNPSKAQALSNFQKGEKNTFWFDKEPQDFVTAIKNAGLVSEWAQFQQSVKRSLVQQQALSVPKENAMLFHSLEKQRLQLETESNLILQRHPAAVDTYADLLRQRNEERMKQQLAPPPPVGKGDGGSAESGYQPLVNNFLINANNRGWVDAGVPVNPNPYGPPPMFQAQQQPALTIPNNIGFTNAPQPLTNSVPAATRMAPAPAFSAAPVAAAPAAQGGLNSIISRMMPTLSHAAKAINAQGGSWRDFQVNLLDANPDLLGVSRRELEMVQNGSDIQELYNLALTGQSAANNISPAAASRANPAILGRVMPILSKAAKSIHSQGGGWRDFQGNLYEADPQRMGLSPNELQALQNGSDVQQLYEAALLHDDRQPTNNIGY